MFINDSCPAGLLRVDCDTTWQSTKIFIRSVNFYKKNIYKKKWMRCIVRVAVEITYQSQICKVQLAGLPRLSIKCPKQLFFPKDMYRYSPMLSLCDGKSDLRTANTIISPICKNFDL